MSSILVVEKPDSANKLNAAWRIRPRMGSAGYVFCVVGLGDAGFVILILDIFHLTVRYEVVPLLIIGTISYP
jgi:hypothetical protein